VAALAQNGDGLRADQAGAADHDDLHGVSLVDDWNYLNGLENWVRMLMGQNIPASMRAPQSRTSSIGQQY
jgi:hypothetical protein